MAGAVIAGAGSALAIATLVLTYLDRQSPPPYTLAGLDASWSLAVRTLVQTVGLITISLISGILVWRRPRALLSLLFLVLVAALSVQVFAGEYAIYGLLVAPGSLPFADLAGWSQKFLPDLGLLPGLAFLMLFPDGRLSSPRWRILLAFAVLYVVCDLVIGLDDPYPLRVAGVWVPVTLPPAVWPLGASLSFSSGAVSWGQPLLAFLFGTYLIIRLVLASGVIRQQLKWFAYAGAVFFLAFALQQADHPPNLEWLPNQIRQAVNQFAGGETAHAIASWSGLMSWLAALVLLPAAIGVAMVRYRLYDIDIVINRTILYGGLALFVTGGYALVVAGVGSLLGQRVGLSPLLSIVTIALLAAVLLPVRNRLQQIANIAVYGKRARPYDVLANFSDELARAQSPDVLLARMAQLLREGTGAVRTEVWVRVGARFQLAASAPPSDGAEPALESADEILARTGPNADLETVSQDGEALGAVVVLKARGQLLTSMERRLLHNLASQAGLVLARFRLVQELRESRARLVSAQDAERRRIERNLHDGAQQRFANALLALGMAGANANAPDDREELIRGASREVQAGLSELRTLARGLQPPLLAEAGLIAAVQALADRAPITTTVVAESGGRCPAPIETTAYFFVAEALANAAKHAGASTVEVRIRADADWLHLEVSDNGVGGADPTRGSGLIGLQDRVAASGGRLEIQSLRGTGTVLRAELPCA